MKIFKISFTETEFENGLPKYQDGKYGKLFVQHGNIPYIESENSEEAIEKFVDEFVKGYELIKERYRSNIVPEAHHPEWELIKRTDSELIYSEIDSDRTEINSDFKAIPIEDLYELDEVYNGSDEFIYKTNYDEYYIVSDDYSEEEQYVYKWDYTKAPDESVFSTENRSLWDSEWLCKCSMTNNYLQACLDNGTGDRGYSNEEWEIIKKVQDEELRQYINLYENEEYRN